MPIGDEMGGVVNNINIDLTPLVNTLKKDEKILVRDCAITLYTYTNFEQTEKSNFQLAKECVDRAIVMINELKTQGII